MNTQAKWTFPAYAAIAITLAGVAAHLPAAADTPAATVTLAYETHSTVVRYDDLDLNREAGMRTLNARLESAAKQVCGPSDIRRLREHRFWHQCRSNAISNAIAQIDDRRFVQWATAARRAPENARHVGE
jgi:UrcA family protein